MICMALLLSVCACRCRTDFRARHLCGKPIHGIWLRRKLASIGLLLRVCIDLLRIDLPTILLVLGLRTGGLLKSGRGLLGSWVNVSGILVRMKRLARTSALIGAVVGHVVRVCRIRSGSGWPGLHSVSTQVGINIMGGEEMSNVTWTAASWRAFDRCSHEICTSCEDLCVPGHQRWPQETDRCPESRRWSCVLCVGVPHGVSRFWY